MIAYHWLTEAMTAGSGNEPAWAVGEERTYKGKPVLYNNDYHSSPTLLQALQYAPGPVASVVEVSEPISKAANKQVSETHKLLAAINVKSELLTWAADCAERALTREREAGREPDKRSWDAIAAVRRYIAGAATEDEVRHAAAYAANAANVAYAAYAANAANAAANAAYAANAAAYAAKAAANAAYAVNAAAYAAKAATYAAYAAAYAAYAAKATAYAAYRAYTAKAAKEDAWQRQRFEDLILSRLPIPQELLA